MVHNSNQVINLNLKLQLYTLNFISFFSISIILSQMIPYLNYLGYTLDERSMILAGIAFVATFGQISFGYWLNTSISTKRLYFISYLIFVLASIVMLAQNFNYLLIHFVTISIMGGFARIIISINETWMFMYKSYDYGKLRSFGAIGLSIGGPISGMIIDHYSYNFLVYILFICCSIILTLLNKLKENHKVCKSIKLKEMFNLLRNKKFMCLIIIFFFIYMIGSADQFIVIDKMINLNASHSLIGLKWAIQSFAEIPLYFFIVRILKKIKPIYVLMISIIMYFIKFILYAMVQSAIGILVVSSLQICTLPLFVASSKYLINDVVDKQYRDFSQMFAMSIFIGLSGFITPFIVNFIQNIYGIDISIYIIASIALIPLIITIFYNHHKS